MARGVLRGVLRQIGKSERKVAAVFGCSPDGCHAAVEHLRKGAPEIPVWLFCTSQPHADTAALCERIYVNRSPAALFCKAQLALWPVWVAIAVTTWTGEGGYWPVKLAPFLIPPFRVLILNSHGGFFAGTPKNISLHVRRTAGDRVHSGWNRTKDVSSSVLLLLLTNLLRWCGYPDRWLFTRMHGDETLPVAPASSRADRLVRMRHNENAWNGSEIERCVTSSDARWILFEADSAATDVEDLVALFDDPRTFAVSRQAYYRESRTQLMGMAPFRSLLPGEVTQVLAPLCPVILVDRGKLAALGVPKASLTGTAWLLLFWKAAAAGWRSYSVGKGGDLSRQPDFPPQERAFILRVLSDPALRRLGPKEPDLGRGNIAWAPARRAVSQEERRLKVLLVSPFLPYPLSHGGAVRIFNLCRELAGRVDYILLAMREAGDTPEYGKLHEIFREVYVVDRDELPGPGGRLPRQVREHESRSLRALIADLARRFDPDVLQIEYTHMAGYRSAAPHIPALLVEHDLTFALYRQLAEHHGSAGSRREYQRWRAFERGWLGVYDSVWTVSEKDKREAMAEGNRTADRTFTVPNGVDIARFAPSPEHPADPEVLFVGSFRHLPNILAFEKLIEEVMPRVWGRIPKARLRVVAGPEPGRFLRELAGGKTLTGLDPRVEVHGFVEDLRPYYSRASVVTAPLAASAGTNIKVLEAMACGKAIVTTPAGCSGLDLVNGVEALIVADWVEFAEGVCALLANPALRVRLGDSARRTAVERFSWDAIAEAAYSSYLTLSYVTHKLVTQATDGNALSTGGAGRGDGATPAGRAI